MKRVQNIALVAIAALALVGCEQVNRDPFEQKLTWSPTGANDANLRAMLSNPNDMVVGRGERGSNAILANAAVTRVLTDKVKPLPKVSTGSTAGTSESAQGGGGGPTTGLGATGGGQ